VQYDGGIVALRGVDLRVFPGQFVSIVGPSGCGKSTLLKAIAGLVPATAGHLLVGDSPVGRGAVAPASLSFVFQEPTLLAWRTVAANVRLPMELRGDERARSVARAVEMLELVGLADFAGRYPSELSGGMQMRASLARALVTSPDALLLDEPFGALDEITRQRLNEDLLRIWLDERWTGLFVTHNVFEAVFLSQRVLVMSDRPGRIIEDVPIDLPYPRLPEVRTRPEFAELAGLVSARLREGG
jgi:NitT/TauT family transport system ATP-binding protein